MHTKNTHKTKKTDNGFLEIETYLLYCYYPVGPSSLSLAVVMFTTQDIPSPYVPNFGLKSVPPAQCPDEGIKLTYKKKYITRLQM